MDKKLTNIKLGKGRKDRTSLLSDSFLKTFQEYKKEYNPKYWPFEEQRPNFHISSKKYLKKIFESAKKKAGISKDTAVHSFKTYFFYSFA